MLYSRDARPAPPQKDAVYRHAQDSLVLVSPGCQAAQLRASGRRHRVSGRSCPAAIHQGLCKNIAPPHYHMGSRTDRYCLSTGVFWMLLEQPSAQLLTDGP